MKFYGPILHLHTTSKLPVTHLVRQDKEWRCHPLYIFHFFITGNHSFFPHSQKVEVLLCFVCLFTKGKCSWLRKCWKFMKQRNVEWSFQRYTWINAPRKLLGCPACLVNLNLNSIWLFFWNFEYDETKMV